MTNYGFTHLHVHCKYDLLDGQLDARKMVETIRNTRKQSKWQAFKMIFKNLLNKIKSKFNFAASK